MPTISLCMITKDEEEFLDKCLDSVKELVDEIIIVDTGSKDRTKEIAKKFGAVLIEAEWPDDFSKARNLSLEKATKDYILVLDADETISRKDIIRIRDLLKEDYDGYAFIQRSYMHSPASLRWQSSKNDDYEESRPYPGWMYSEITRLFRNRPDIRFEYPVHETVKESIKRLKGRILKTKIPIHHYGKLRSNLNEKNKMYFSLGKKKLKSAPDAKFYFELAVQAQVLGKLDEADRLFVKAIKLKPEWYLPYIPLGTIRLKKDPRKALKIFEKAVKLAPSDANAHNNLGVANEKLNNIAEAIKHYNKAIELDSSCIEALHNLSRIYYMQKDISKIKSALEQILSITPNDISALNNLAGIYLNENKHNKAIGLLESSLSLEPNNINTLRNLAIAYISINNKSKASVLLKRAIALDPKNNELNEMLSSLH